ncbi:T9SS type A sorting domain-containing protein [Flavobacterium branchiophilum]|uniref:DUF7619 domain-containing protein n=1 Tax=Flavobacterium branchiophilum TaxID=55197 RepID=UPI0005C48350|nr:T9SS type A sorting domain-containing protein [Flavobacterium branchiophilum]
MYIWYYLFHPLQNTGNACSINIEIKDSLNPKIDETSIRMVGASHNYTLDRTENQLSWKMNNIQLPVAVANSDIGKGYVTFQAKLKPGFNIGDIIPNNAQIYFDFNPVIITNTFNTELVATLGNENIQWNNAILFPNPASNQVQIKLTNNQNIQTIKIIDITGKELKTYTNLDNEFFTIPLNEYKTGVYIIEIISTNKTKSMSKLIIK